VGPSRRLARRWGRPSASRAPYFKKCYLLLLRPIKPYPAAQEPAVGAGYHQYR